MGSDANGATYYQIQAVNGQCLGMISEAEGERLFGMLEGRQKEEMVNIAQFVRVRTIGGADLFVNLTFLGAVVLTSPETRAWATAWNESLKQPSWKE